MSCEKCLVFSDNISIRQSGDKFSVIGSSELDWLNLVIVNPSTFRFNNLCVSCIEKFVFETRSLKIDSNYFDPNDYSWVKYFEEYCTDRAKTLIN